MRASLVGMRASLLSLVGIASAYRLEVPFWTDDAGYCEPLPGLGAGVHRPTGLSNITIYEGTTLVFKYSTHHDVWIHPTASSLASCDYNNGATQLAGRQDGSGCANEANLTCMRAAAGFEHRIRTPGTYYFSCSVSDHCANGQRLTVTVLPTSAPVPQHPMNVVVPYWTDDAGYCKDSTVPGFIGYGGRHRPFGLRPISLLTGQNLVFKFSTHHDVWAHPTLESLQACDYSSAIQLAGQSDGGGCQNDEDLACIAASTGYTLTPTQDEMYLSCSVHDHCENGQRLVVKVLPAPCPHEGTTGTEIDVQNAAVLSELQETMEDLLERWQDDEEREERQEETLSSPILRNRILLVEGVFGVLIVLLIFGVFAFITLCCVCRYTRSVYNATLRRGGGGAVPSFNRLETEMASSSNNKPEGAV